MRNNGECDPLCAGGTQEGPCYPVWVKLHGLPLSCWSIDSLSRIRSAIGVPKKVGECTVAVKRVSYARLLVHVDLTMPHIREIIIEVKGGNEFLQSVKYEFAPLSLPRVCMR